MQTLRLVTFAAALAALGHFPAHAQHVLGGETIGLGTDDGALTPDGRLAVTRENTAASTAVIWDVATGAQLMRYEASGGAISGSCCDAVEVTDTRAVVIGTSIQVLDLGTIQPAPIAEYPLNAPPRDLAIDALGRFVLVRASDSVRVLDLSNGAQLLSVPSTTTSPGGPYDVDAAVATADHGVATDYDQLSSAGVTIVEFAPSTGGPPRVVYQSPPNARLAGRPHDLAVSPDGQWCGVRSDQEVALYRLDGTNTRLMWKASPSVAVNPFDDSAMDSIVLTDDWLFTMGRSASPVGFTVTEAYDHAGGRSIALLPGDPHDLDLTPDQGRFVMRTSQRLGVVDVSQVQVGAGLFVHEVDTASVVTGFGAGLDSVAASNTHVAATFVRASGPIGRIYAIDGTQPVFERTIGLLGAPLDVAFTPDGTRAVFTSLPGVQVYDLRTRTLTLSERPVVGNGWWPWCDGLDLNAANALAFGIGLANGGGGWTSLLDLFDEPAAACPSFANSTGAPGVLVATGSSRPASNDLTLWARGLPGGVTTLLAYGALGAPVRFGDGALCLAGPVLGRYITPAASAAGDLRIDLDQAAVSTGPGTFLVGTTWLFQLVHRDPGAVSGHNVTNGLLVPFLN
ncbi:MAG: hypothetical protein R3F49_09790 [Planctomycetota bacterium]